MKPNHIHRVIDMHTHIYPEKVRAKAVRAIGDFYDLPMQGLGSSEHLLELGVPFHVSNYLVCSAATAPSQVHSINNFIAGEASKHPEFIGFATLHPWADDMAAEIERFPELGLKGLKIHPDFQQFNIDDDKTLAMYRLLPDEYPILVHMGDRTRDFSAPRRLARVLNMFPNKIFIAAHFGGHDAIPETTKYLIDRDDMYIDTSSSLYALPPDEAAELIHRHSVERTLFGTDYPMWLYGDELERFMAVPLTQEEREMILWKNAAKLLKLDN